MRRVQLAANPFALMMDPQSVLHAAERSGHLSRLKSHVCRPLDKPVIPRLNEPVFSPLGDEPEPESIARLRRRAAEGSMRR